MDTRFVLHTRRHARGAIKPVAIAIIAVFAVLAVAAWFLILKPHQELVMSDSGGHPSTPVSTVTRVAPPPANVAAMDLEQLLAEARTAMNEQRYLAPAGNNAFEFYLRVLEKDPGNKVASDALRETFPFAAPSAEQAINAREFSEAQRQIDLLAKADPTNFTLTILRSKLDAQRKTLNQEQKLALEQEKAAQLAAQKAAADKLAAAQLAAQPVQATTQAGAAPTAGAQDKTASATPPATDAADASAPSVVQSTPAVLVRAVAARYPSAARRTRRTGWVVVSFTVGTDGKTTNISVVSSQPGHLFDRAATDAVERYTFTPATLNGVPVASIKQQRIEFKL